MFLSIAPKTDQLYPDEPDQAHVDAHLYEGVLAVASQSSKAMPSNMPALLSAGAALPPVPAPPANADAPPTQDQRITFTIAEWAKKWKPKDATEKGKNVIVFLIRDSKVD
jgi:hypothetical protein